MFYSQLLLSKKGALGIVWMAAHCHKRLKKDQIQKTNVSSSVDKILDNEVPVVTHRILAFLLLGVVRIYSKKVEYLFHDCYEILDKLHHFRMEKRKQASIGVSLRHYHSITLPKRFELDAFDLEQSVDQDFVRGEARSEEPETVLEDGCQNDGDVHGLISKVIPFSEASTTDCTPLRDVFSAHYVNKHLLICPSINMNNSLVGGISFCLEDRLDPMVLDEAEEDLMQNKQYEDGTRTCSAGLEMESESAVNLSNKISHSAPSLEVLRGSLISVEGHLDSMALDEPEIIQTDDRPSAGNVRTNFLGPMQDVEFGSVARPSPQGSDFVPSTGVRHQSGFTFEHSPTLKMLSEAGNGQGLVEPSDSLCEGTKEQVDHLNAWTSVHEKEPPCQSTNSVDKAQKNVTLSEANTPNKKKSLRTVELPIPIVSPHSKIPDVSTPAVASVQTPGTKERAKIQKKRKTLFDQTTVLPNKILKKWIEKDSSDLKRKRQKAPLSVLHAWRAGKLGHAPQNFLNSFLSDMSIGLSCLASEKICPAMELSPRRHEVRSLDDDAQVGCKQIPDVGSPEQAPIAPRTPVTNLNEARIVAEPPTISPESVEKQAPSYERLELNEVFQEETSSCHRDSLETDAHSARTRMVLQNLSRRFLVQKRDAKKRVLSLSQLLQGKTKEECAQLFYEILVLKSRDCIEVEQAKAYDDILLRPTEDEAV